MNPTQQIVRDIISDFKATRTAFRDVTSASPKMPPDLLAELPETYRSQPYRAVQLALLSDVFHLVDRAIHADGVVSSEELELARALTKALAPAYVEAVGGPYARFVPLTYLDALPFLEEHRKHGAFPEIGNAPWLSMRFARALRQALGDDGPRQALMRLSTRVLDSVVSLGGINEAERRFRSSLEAELTSEPLPGDDDGDPREKAFCSAEAPEVFHSTAYMNHVHRPDPFDVDSIHATARETFEQALGQVGMGAPSGRILLVLGEAGAGKTHLMRAFRNRLHGTQTGVLAYMQMSSSTQDYARYILRNTIDSLEHPYDGDVVQAPTISVLSDALVERFLGPEIRERLRDEEASDEDLGMLTLEAADRLADLHGFHDVPSDLLRALLFLQRREVSTRQRVLKYLRCDPMSELESRRIGGIRPTGLEEAPTERLVQLGRLIERVGFGRFVLVLDQLEELYALEQSQLRFSRAVGPIHALVNRLPNLLIVISCLQEFWQEMRTSLNVPLRHRIESDVPRPVSLEALRDRDEAQQLIEVRLSALFEAMDVRVDPDEPCFPFDADAVNLLSGMTTRHVLEACRLHQQACRNAGHLVPMREATHEPPSRPREELAQMWNDFRAEFTEEVDASDAPGLAQLLEEALRERGVPVERRESNVAFDRAGRPRVAIICNWAPQGGHFHRKLESALTDHDPGQAILVRSTEFPGRPGTGTYEALGKVIAAGGRKVVAEDADFRTILAFRTFRSQHRDHPQFDAWTRSQHPLMDLDLLAQVLDEDATVAPPRPADSEASEAQDPREAPPPAASKPTPSDGAGPLGRASAKKPADRERERPNDGQAQSILLGHSRGLNPQPVRLRVDRLVRHAAFLGSSGSGKTTLALHVIEQLAERGVPCLMIDRKGDLVSYADPQSWPDSERASRLRDRLAVRVYTPGLPTGRPLGFPIIPHGLASAPSHLQALLAQRAAGALAAMMDLRGAAAQSRLVILAKAIEILGTLQADPENVGLETLIEFIASDDPNLLNALGRLSLRHTQRLVQDLELLRLGAYQTLGTEHELFDAGSCLGRRGPSDRVPLTIISTKFLTDADVIDAWVARLLIDLIRWSSANPAQELQGVVFLDEADLYVPAVRRTASKANMMELLRRSRSAGLGLFIATQSPGDMDYRARDQITNWFVGKVTQATAIQKMRPLLSEAKVRIDDKLPNAGVGEFFWVEEGNVTELKSDRSLLETVQQPDDRIRDLARTG